MFLEAEKFGFDIRGSANGKVDEGATFGFNFGGGTGGEASIKMGAEEEVESSTTPSSARIAVDISSSMDTEDVHTTNSPSVVDSGITVTVMPLFDVAVTAKTFRRDADEDHDVVSMEEHP